MYLLHASALAQVHQHANCPKVNLLMQMRGRTGSARSEPDLYKKAGSWIVRLYSIMKGRGRPKCFFMGLKKRYFAFNLYQQLIFEMRFVCMIFSQCVCAVVCV